MDTINPLSATWEDGGIRSDGTDSTATGIRIRTNYISLSADATKLNVTMITGYSYVIYYYNSNQVKISSVTWQSGNTENNIPSNTAYVRISLRKGDGTPNIPVSDGDYCDIAEVIPSVTKYGIDVSYYQLTIDWEKVAYESDKEFAIIRAGYGTGTKDKAAITNATECTRIGFPFGLYWFSYAYTVDMARNEGIAVAEFATYYNVTLPIYWDFEYDSEDYARQHGVTMTGQLYRDMANAFCAAVESYGFTSGLYYNPDYDQRFNIASFFTQYPNRSKFIAAWGSTPPSDYDIWQYGVSAAGDVPGITTQVDLDMISNIPVPPIPPVPPEPSESDSMPLWFYLKLI